MRFAQLVIGPAGCGKSTYCHTIQEHCRNIGRTCRVINMDPAAEDFKYEPVVDVRELISVDEVMENFQYGPNGALMFAMEYALKKMDWLEENFDCFGDDDFLLIDCPGQIELYTHDPVMRQFLKELENWDYRIVAVYCMDVSFVTDSSKFLSGSLSALSAMVMLEIPHINVLTKFDLLSPEDKERVDELLEKSPCELTTEVQRGLPQRYRRFNESLIGLLEEWSMVSFAVLDLDDEDSIGNVLLLADMAIQYGENQEPEMKFDQEADSVPV